MTPTTDDEHPDERTAAAADGPAGGRDASGGPAIPTISVNAAEADPDPQEATSDSTARHKASDYDNDREDLPGS